MSSASLTPTFSPKRIITTLAHNKTPGGGEPNVFISVIFGFLRQLTASFADSRAGSAYLSAISASVFNFSASIEAILVFSSSSLAIAVSYSAIELS